MFQDVQFNDNTIVKVNSQTKVSNDLKIFLKHKGLKT